MSQIISIHDAFLSILLSDSDSLELENIFHKIRPEMFPTWKKSLFKILKESYEKNSALDLTLLEITGFYHLDEKLFLTPGYLLKILWIVETEKISQSIRGLR